MGRFSIFINLKSLFISAITNWWILSYATVPLLLRRALTLAPAAIVGRFIWQWREISIIWKFVWVAIEIASDIRNPAGQVVFNIQFIPKPISGHVLCRDRIFEAASQNQSAVIKRIGANSAVGCIKWDEDKSQWT
jgi:hypothetical protein